MSCSEFQELLIAQGEGILCERQATDLAGHLRSCPACRAEAEGFARLRARLLRDGSGFAGARPDARVMDRILQEHTPDLRRLHMIRRYATRLSLATVSVAAAVALVVVLISGPSGSTAYALEQTVAAYRGVRSIHLRAEPAGQGLGEAWGEFGDDGSLLRLRMDFPASQDGPKSVVWEKGKAQVWFKAKNSLWVLREPGMLAKVRRFFPDPKAAVERLYEAEAGGKVRIEAEGPAGDDGVIRLTVTVPDLPDTREVWLVVARTKFLKEIQKQKLEGREYTTTGRIELLAHDQPIDPAVFAFDLPTDVMVVDQTTQEVGLARGDLRESEIAVKVARSFYEALIAGDYAAAGRLCGGVPAAALQEKLSGVRYLRIVSIGEPAPDADPRTRTLRVPCEVEVEVKGLTSVRQCRPSVRPVYNQPDRWAISGGI